MKKLFSAALVLIPLFAVAAPAPAEARGGVRVDVGIGCCGGGYGYYPPGWGYYGYPGYYQPYYVAPPPVVYVPPSAYYPAPAPVTYAAPVQSSIPADQTSATYTNESGQTCREYQTTAIVGGVSQPTYGTACLQPDGSWRAVR